MFELESWLLQTFKRDCKVIVDVADLASSNKKSVIRVLHVDDDLCFLEVSKQIISMENSFEIDNASSVDEALKKMEQQQYDAVVSDYEMPQKNGLEFLKEIRDQNNQIPFILFTGKGREDVAVKALNLGADRYINKNGSPETVYCELADAINKIVEQKKSRKLLAASESKYRVLVEKSLQGILVTEVAPLRLVFANGAMGNFLGYSPQELMSLSPEGIMGLVYHEDRAVFFKRLENRFRNETAEPCLEFRAVHKDGSLIWLSALANRVDYDGQPAVQGMFLDITERKKAEEVLRRSEERYRELANSLPEIVFEADLTGKITFFSQRTLETTGYTREDLENGLNMLKFVVPEEQEKVKENFKKLITGENLGVNEYTLVRKNGTPYPALVRTTPIISENKVKGIRGLVIDITERKKAELALKESEEKYRKLFEASMDAIFVADIETGIIVDCNPAASTLVGREKSELVGQHQSIITPQEQMEAGFARVFKQHLKDQTKTFETQIIMKTGEIRDVAVRDTIIELEGKKLMQGTIRDITEHKKAEESSKKQTALIDLSPDAVIVKNMDETITFWNAGAEKLYGYTKQEALGQKINILLKAKYSKLFDDVITQLRQGKSWTGEITNYTRNNNEVTVQSYWSATLDAQGDIVEILESNVDITERKKTEEAIKFQADLLNHIGQAVMMVDSNRIIRFWNKAAEKLYGWSEEQALGHQVTELLGGTLSEEVDEAAKRLMAGESLSTEVLAENRDGSVVPVILNRTPIFNEDGEFVGVASIAADITLQKNTEADLTFSLVSLSNSLDKIEELNEKLRVVGGLTRHDVRNKLSAVTGYAYILKKKHGDQADVVDGLSRMEQAVQETTRIFDFAKMYEQIGVEELTYIDVEEKLKEAVALFSGPIPTIINDCHGLTVLADSFLRQLFFNFIDNTRKHGKKTTTIRVYFEKADQDSLKLVYEDDGVGVPSENKPRLFKEGYSTGGSTGFGLFLTKRMMDVYDWQIQENGTPGEGAKFTITIPKLSKSGKENYQIAQ